MIQELTGYRIAEWLVTITSSPHLMIEQTVSTDAHVCRHVKDLGSIILLVNSVTDKLVQEEVLPWGGAIKERGRPSFVFPISENNGGAQ